MRGEPPVTKRKPLPPSRPTQRLWDLLTPDEQRLMASLMGNAIAAEPLPRRVQLECLREIELLMRLKPRELELWPNWMVDRNLPDDD